MIRKIFTHVSKRLKKAPKDEKTDSQETPRRKEQLHRKTTSPQEQDTVKKSTRSRRRRSHKKKKKTVQNTDVKKQSNWDIADFKVARKDAHTRFHDLDIPDEIMHAIHDMGFEYCTPIQSEILPQVLNGRDATGRAQTGTGKTAAFLITILRHFLRNPLEKAPRNGTPRALIMAPTRELAMQIEKDAIQLTKYMNCRILSVYGGMDYKQQLNALTQEKIDIIVATPGRLLDYKNQKKVHLNHVEILVIDEADRMLDMGFIPDMRKIIRSTPARHDRQTLLFSATLTSDVIRLASQWTHDPIKVEIEPEQLTVDTVSQVTYIITDKQKFSLTWNVITKKNLQKVLVFCNRRDTARVLTDRLSRRNMPCALLSGEVAQKKRVKTLEQFRNGDIRVLVATDVAARGIHVDDISHVINYNLPEDPESYVHRIGRTGRAGAHGIAISFASEEDGFLIPQLEEFLEEPVACEYPPDELLEPAPKAERPHKPQTKGRGRGGSKRRGGSNRNRSGNNNRKRRSNRSNRSRNNRSKKSSAN